MPVLPARVTRALRSMEAARLMAARWWLASMEALAMRRMAGKSAVGARSAVSWAWGWPRWCCCEGVPCDTALP